MCSNIFTSDYLPLTKIFIFLMYSIFQVYAVEASDIAEQTKKVVKSNGFSDVIEMIKGYAEDIVLEDKVDLIVSEWMGTMLLVSLDAVS